MSASQNGILLPLPPLARYLSFACRPDADLRTALRGLSAAVDGEHTVAGLGASLAAALGVAIEGLHDFPPMAAQGKPLPSTPAALWLWLRGNDRGELWRRSQRLEQLLAPAFRLDSVVDAFVYDGGRDLTGYEDGTENPKGEDARAAALAEDGSSFVAVQQWQHDFAAFAAMTAQGRDHAIGRRLSDNEEIEEAPESAHVKRTAQESFEPEAFMFRRSMPWTEGPRGGLMFVAFGASFYAFEAQLQRMVGAEDGISDALFRFTQPLTGAYYWCPPLREGRLDLAKLGVR